MMMKSSTFLLPQNLHFYNKKGEIGSSSSRRVYNIGRIILFVLWVLGLTSIFTLFIFHSPKSFEFNPQTTLKVNTMIKYFTNETSLSLQPKIGNINENKCNLFKGRWIRDLRGPLYNSSTCELMPDWKNCPKYGKKNLEYLNWRWKPDECDLLRFDPKAFLSIVRGKNLAFIGDSVARNQMESLLCLLSQEEIPKEIYKYTDDQFKTFYFPSHNFTLMVFWIRFMVTAEERVENNTNTGTGVFNIHIDKVDDKWTKKLADLDYAIISDAHWFFRQNYFYENDKVIGCVYCDKEPNIPNLGMSFALRKAFRAALEFINGCKECEGLVTFLRTYSPPHFEYGTWNNGGKCNRTSPFREDEIKLEGIDWELRNIQVEEIERIKLKKEGERDKRFEVLDVTKAMMMRPDGHPGSNWPTEFRNGYNDCLHWCLPGPVDLMNELLLAMLQKIHGGP